MAFRYRTKGVCARNISFDIVNGKITAVSFDGGCAGNTKGVARLVDGMPAEEAIERLEGITCGFKGTSCPDQLAKAIRQALEGNM